MPATPQVSSIGESDFPAVAAFAAKYARAGEAISADALSPEERLRWVLLDNPARSADAPFGWCTRDGESGALVSTLLCVPFRVGAGDFSCTALMASKFYADPNHRGAGIGPLMRFVQEGRRFPLLMTSSNAIAGELYRKCGAYQIEQMDHTMLGVRRPGPLAEEWVFRRTRSVPLARVLALPGHFFHRNIARFHVGGQLVPLTTADQATSFSSTPPQGTLAVIRDVDYIRWRYFGKERGKDVYRFKLAGSDDRLVAVRLARSGHRGQIRVLDVLDLWPPADPQMIAALVSNLAMRYKGLFDVIWLRSQSDEPEQALHRIGFTRHAFPAPLGWCIDREGKLPTRRWYLMPGESE